MCTHESIPLDRRGGASTRHVMNLLLCVGTCAIFNACTTSMLCIRSGIPHMHASHTSINMSGTHTCNNGCLWINSHSLGYGRQDYIYSWACVDVHHIDQWRERLQGKILLLCFELPYSRLTNPSLIKFERMLRIVNPRDFTVPKHGATSNFCA